MEIDLKQILLQLASFGILFAILAKYLFRPLLKILDERSRTISAGIAAAEKSLKAEKEFEKKRESKLIEAEKKAAAILASARDESKKLGKELLEEARLEAQKMVAKQETAFKEKMREQEEELKSRIGDMVIETTRVVLGKSLSPKDLKNITKQELASLLK